MKSPYMATGALLLALTASEDATAQGAKVTSSVELARTATSLKPGEWVWAPQIAPDGPVTVYVDLSSQTATVYRNGVRMGVSTVSTGKAGHETPTGVFTILQKDPHHHSKKYNNAPMPFQERLTWDGIALHAGGLPGYPESHGCVHLPFEFSRLLFGITQLGGTVVIAGAAGQPIGTPGQVLAETGEASNLVLAPGESYRWTPEVSPAGPVTMVVSRSDGRIIVLRNGREIGRARVEVPAGDFETHVLTRVQNAQGAPAWTFVGVPGHQGEAGKPLDAAVMAQVRMPAAFRKAVQSVLAPGTTILVTQAPVLPTTTGKSITVLASATS